MGYSTLVDVYFQLFFQIYSVEDNIIWGESESILSQKEGLSHCILVLKDNANILTIIASIKHS